MPQAGMPHARRALKAFLRRRVCLLTLVLGPCWQKVFCSGDIWRADAELAGVGEGLEGFGFQAL